MNASKKIIIIDDDTASVAELKKFLESKGYAISCLNDGLQAVDVIKDVEPDLILLDIIMPGLDGFSIAKQIRHDEQIKKIPIVVFSAQEGMKELFAIEGINEYLVKPVDKEKLLETILKKLGQ